MLNNNNNNNNNDNNNNDLSWGCRHHNIIVVFVVFRGDLLKDIMPTNYNICIPNDTRKANYN